MSFSDTFETHVLNYVFTTTSVTRPTAWYVGLFTADPTDTGSGATEISGNSYTRKAATFTVSGNAATTSGAIEFTAATGSWGTISHIGIFDASSSGNLIAHSALSVSKTIGTGDVFRIPAGDIDITLN
jgi:hypothetical protein|tara:strand:- start:235 stop:618 length:384 start_codon:yes stop_codon:yes gene_type:complete